MVEEKDDVGNKQHNSRCRYKLQSSHTIPIPSRPESQLLTRVNGPR